MFRFVFVCHSILELFLLPSRPNLKLKIRVFLFEEKKTPIFFLSAVLFVLYKTKHIVSNSANLC